MDEEANDEPSSTCVSAAENPADKPASRPRLPDIARHYSSKLDVSQGALRTTSDGNLLETDTGDWLVLDTPPHNLENRKMAIEKGDAVATSPTIILPEAKNGATAFDNPRARKPLTRILRNKITGSDRLPVEEQADLLLPAKEDLRTNIAQMRKAGGGIDLLLLERIRQNYGIHLMQIVGENWLEQAKSDEEFWERLLDAVLETGESWDEKGRDQEENKTRMGRE